MTSNSPLPSGPAFFTAIHAAQGKIERAIDSSGVKLDPREREIVMALSLVQQMPGLKVAVSPPPGEMTMGSPTNTFVKVAGEAPVLDMSRGDLRMDFKTPHHIVRDPIQYYLDPQRHPGLEQKYVAVQRQLRPVASSAPARTAQPA